jgi:circadian clock protein KaiA
MGPLLPNLVCYTLVSPLHIHVLARSADIIQALDQSLDEGKYLVYANTDARDFLTWLQDHPDRLDCLVVDAAFADDALLRSLAELGLLVPMVILSPAPVPDGKPRGASSPDSRPASLAAAYHTAVVDSPIEDLGQIEAAIRQAIQQFIALPAESCILPTPTLPDSLPIPDLISAQKERLTDKLKARLGYLGVYYKRNPDNFLRNMREADRDQYLSQLRAGYRKIVLGYFSHDAKLNQNIDDFVNQAFFADIAVSHIVEIHMELMDEFSKQLKLEGRSEEILLDYRLTLIDVIAHLCEMYRRSIPREP